MWCTAVIDGSQMKSLLCVTVNQHTEHLQIGTPASAFFNSHALSHDIRHSRAVPPPPSPVMQLTPHLAVPFHQVTCGVNVKSLDQVLQSVRGSLQDAGVTANIITSGHGEWR